MCAMNALINAEMNSEVDFFDRAAGIRPAKVEGAKRAIREGTIDPTGHKLDVAAGRLADRILDANKPEAPALPDGFACADWDGLS